MRFDWIDLVATNVYRLTPEYYLRRQRLVAPRYDLRISSSSRGKILEILKNTYIA